MGASCTGVDGSKYAEYYSIIHASHKCVLILNQAGEMGKRRPTDGLKAKSESEREKAGKDGAGSQ